jgi:hypothetical protein
MGPLLLSQSKGRTRQYPHTTISLKHALPRESENYKNRPIPPTDSSEEPEFKGECAAGVQYVFFKAGKPPGKVSTWKQGPKVKGGSVAPGTAIASFRDGVYKQDHAAIFGGDTNAGFEVRDQYDNPPKAGGKRTIQSTKENDYSNNPEYFCVVTK